MFAVNCQATAPLSPFSYCKSVSDGSIQRKRMVELKRNIHSMFIYEIKHWKTSNRIIEYVSLAIYAHWQAMLTNIG